MKIHRNVSRLKRILFDLELNNLIFKINNWLFMSLWMFIKMIWYVKFMFIERNFKTILGFHIKLAWFFRNEIVMVGFKFFSILAQLSSLWSDWPDTWYEVDYIWNFLSSSYGFESWSGVQNVKDSLIYKELNGPIDLKPSR